MLRGIHPRVVAAIAWILFTLAFVGAVHPSGG